MSFDFLIKQGNLSLGADGDLAKIENRDKLEQDIVKIIVTPLRSKRLHPFYGSLINNSLIGNVYYDEQFLASYASTQLRDAIKVIQEMQKAQEKTQYLSPQEALGAIQNVQVKQSETDPRYWAVYVSVITKALQNASVDFDLPKSAL